MDGLVTAVSLLATMGLGAVLALLVLALFGKTARTDAFFAAYAVFAFLSAAAQSMRVSLTGQVLPERGWAPVDRLLGGVVLVAALSAVPFVLLGNVTAEALVGGLGDEAVRTARSTLAFLWVAGASQLIAGLSAAALGARGRFVAPAAGYVAGGVLSVIAVVLLADVAGVTAVGAAVAGGSAVTAGLLVSVLVSDGWRPRRGTGTVAAARQVLAGSLGPLVLQATYVVSLAFAARLGEGAVTLYSYAFFAVLLVVGVTAGPASIVLAGPLASTWDRRSDSLRPVETAVARAALGLAVPLLALGFLLGDDALKLLLGGVLSDADTDTVAALVLALGGLVVGQVVGTVPLVAAFAKQQYARVAVVASATLVVHLVLSAVAVRTDDLRWLAAAASVSAVVYAGGLLVVVHGSGAARVAAAMTADLAGVAGVAAMAFGVGHVAVGARGAEWSVPGAVLGLLVFLAAVRFCLPAWWAVLGGLVRRRAASSG